MLVALKRAGDVWRAIAYRLFIRSDSAPIDSLDALQRFASTRAAYIAQKTLYGYLKTRMGTRYPLMFHDDVFVASVNVAKMHIFAACLSDLTIHAVAHGLQEAMCDDGIRKEIAVDCFRSGLADNADQIVDGFAVSEAVADFARRLDGTDWHFGALRSENFSRSPLALVRWAPIAPELKRLDADIVENSIRFAWRDVRTQLRRRLDTAAIASELRPRIDP